MSQFDLYGGTLTVNKGDAGKIAEILQKRAIADNAFHDKLMSLGVKAYRSDDGWIDRNNCEVTFLKSDTTKGWYWGDLNMDVEDKIFIGNASDGGRFAEITFVYGKYEILSNTGEVIGYHTDRTYRFKYTSEKMSAESIMNL